MKVSEQPWWLLFDGTIGFREEGDDSDDDGDGDGDDEGDEDEGGDDDGGDSGDGDGNETDDKEELKKALREERKLRRKAEREARKAKKSKQTEQDDADLEETKKQLAASRETTQRLADRFRAKAIDDALLEAARDAGFIDPTDVLRDDLRREVDVDQDEDDPSSIEVDEDSAEDAVKEYARKKKHLLKVSAGGTVQNDGQASGGKFKKKGNKEPDKLSDESLKANYPSL